jgi:hypothetical protein
MRTGCNKWAASHRTIRISNASATDSVHSADLLSSKQHAEADIQCWLVNQEYVVISAITLDKGRSLDTEEVSPLERRTFHKVITPRRDAFC